MPKRIQRRRTKGWKMPLGAIYVGRPTKYANWFDWKKYGRAAAKADFYRQLQNWKADDPAGFQRALDELRGHDLACWCSLDEPCHADVWLEFANQPNDYILRYCPFCRKETDHIRAADGRWRCTKCGAVRV